MAHQGPHKVLWAPLWLLLASAALAKEPILRGRCVGVTDGDTIRVLTADQQQFRIRLAWIDAPERGNIGFEANRLTSFRLNIYARVVTTALSFQRPRSSQPNSEV